MSMVTISSRGTIKLSQEILAHLSVSPDRNVELLKMPDGQVTIKQPVLDMTIDQFLGQLIVHVEPSDENVEAEDGRSVEGK